MADKLTITKLKGDDGYKIFSIRVREETVQKLNKISADTNRSRNEVINMMLEYGIKNYEVKEPKDD